VNLWALGYYLASSSEREWSTLSLLGSSVATHTYLILMAIQHLSQTNVPQHWATTVHTASILSVIWLCQAICVMLPDETPGAGNNDIFAPQPGTSTAMRVIQICIALQPVLIFPALAVMVAFVRRGPELYFPMEKLYTQNVLNSLKDHYANQGDQNSLVPEPLDDRRPNVSPEVNTTIIGYILFLHVEPLLHKAKMATSFNTWDLPILQKDMRAMVGLKHMREVYGDTRKLKRRSARPGLMGRLDNLPEGYNLLAKVFVANKGLFTVEMVLAAITAGLYYLPAVFLRQFTKYLEDHPNRENIRYGWVLCFGLAASNAIMFIAVGVLW
jgi:hypothetical protein